MQQTFWSKQVAIVVVELHNVGAPQCERLGDVAMEPEEAWKFPFKLIRGFDGPAGLLKLFVVQQAC
jgi:hypothetical protein